MSTQDIIRALCEGSIGCTKPAQRSYGIAVSGVGLAGKWFYRDHGERDNAMSRAWVAAGRCWPDGLRVQRVDESLYPLGVYKLWSNGAHDGFNLHARDEDGDWCLVGCFKTVTEALDRVPLDASVEMDDRTARMALE